MSARCPCCGQRVVRPHGLDLPPLELSIYTAVMLAGEAGVGGTALVEQLFGGRADGGPLYAFQTVHVTKLRLNARLRTVGLAVRSTGGGRHARYHLRKL